jgi:hypothetical protein
MRVCFDRQSEEYLQKYRTFSILMIRKSEEWWWCKTFMMVRSLHITFNTMMNSATYFKVRWQTASAAEG